MKTVKIKKQKAQKSLSKKKLKFENYKNCLKATQLDNKTNHLENNQIDIDSIKKVIKNSRNNKLILQIPQRFQRERHNIFTEEMSKIVLSSNDNKRMQLIDSIETYAYGTSKDLENEKEEIKCKNLIKRHKK